MTPTETQLYDQELGGKEQRQSIILENSKDLGNQIHSLKSSIDHLYVILNPVIPNKNTTKKVMENGDQQPVPNRSSLSSMIIDMNKEIQKLEGFINDIITRIEL